MSGNWNDISADMSYDHERDKQRRGLVVMNHDLRSTWPGEPAKAESEAITIEQTLTTRALRAPYSERELDARASSAQISIITYKYTSAQSSL